MSKKIPFPSFLIHKKESLPRTRFGERRSAYNWFPYGIAVTSDTEPWTIEQEKFEWYMQMVFITLALTGFVFLPGWFKASSVVLMAAYPGSYAFHWPGSHHIRRFFEIRSHVIELKYRFKHHVDEQYPPGVTRESVKRNLVSSEAFSMANHRAYNLKMTGDELRAALLKRIDVRK